VVLALLAWPASSARRAGRDPLRRLVPRWLPAVLAVAVLAAAGPIRHDLARFVLFLPKGFAVLWSQPMGLPVK
jgi:hypothetical protein